MNSNQKSSMKNSFVKSQSANDDKNDFLQKSNHSLGKSNVSNEVSSPKGKQQRDNVVQNSLQEENLHQQEGDQHYGVQQNGQGQKDQNQWEGNSQDEAKKSRINQHQDHHETYQNETYQINENHHNHEHQEQSDLNNHSNHKESNELKSLLKQFVDQLSTLQKSISHNENSQLIPQNQRKIAQLQLNIQILQIKIRLQEKLKFRKQIISFERINHLALIFKHYCTHIFKTGKHMTFDRLEYEKVHLTIDRLCVFLKDFNLTTIKMKDNKTRQIIEKPQIIKLFKKISSNCKDLNFQQFILILQKLGELYFDSKVTYEERKQNERKQRLKIKENLEKKDKYKQQMLKKHQDKMQRLQKDVNETVDDVKEKLQTQGGENDDLIEKMINEGTDEVDEDKDSRVSKQPQKKQNLSKSKKSASLYSKTFKRQIDIQLEHNKQQNSPLSLTKQQKMEYFYQIINVDDIQSFSNKMRQLNLPLFKIYAGKEQGSKKETEKSLRQDELVSLGQGSKVETDDEKRLKELREKLYERNQKIKNSSVPSLNKEEYELRKLKRSRIQQETDGSIKKQRKQKKIDLTDGQINLSSLSKLAYENVNFSKFNPRAFYKKQDDDDIFLQEYGDSPVRTRKPQAKTQLAKVSQNTSRLINQKDKNSENFLQKLKKRQSEVEISQKKQEVSQMYKFNDRTQRQKRLIDKFLEKNK